MRRARIITAVNKKLAEQREMDRLMEAGVKEWAAGALIALTGLFTNVGDAMASPKSLNQFLESKSQEFKKDKKLKDKVKFESKFKSIGGESGSGTFTIKLGPYTLKGDYQGAGDTLKKFSVKTYEDSEATNSELNEWEGVAEKIENILEKEFMKEQKEQKENNLVKEKKDPKLDKEISEKVDKQHNDYVRDTSKKQQLKKFLDDMESTNQLAHYQGKRLDDIVNHYIKNPKEFKEDYPGVKIKYFND